MKSEENNSPSVANIVLGVLVLFLIFSSVLTITGFLGRFWWWFDQTSHFKVQYVVVQLTCLLCLLPFKRWKLFMACALFAIVNIVQIVPLYLPDARNSVADEKIARKLKFLLINVHTSNRDFEKTIRYSEQVAPDILALEEIDGLWVSAMSDFLKEFPYKMEIPRPDNFGIGLYSRIPFKKANVEYFSEAMVPSVVTEFDISGQSVTVLFTHPLPPGDKSYFAMRNEQLEKIASSRGDFGDNIVVIGDLNITIWSHYYKRFVSKMGVRNSRNGFGILPSWSADIPFMKIPIDHCLVSENIVVMEHINGPFIGSDHYPVYVELAVVKKK